MEFLMKISKNFDAISLIKIKKTPIIRHQRQAL